MRRPGAAPIAALVAMVLVWGYSWVVITIALRHAHPFDFAAMRVGLGAALLFLLVKLRRRGSLSLPGYRMAVLLGLLQVALFIVLSHLALLHAGTGKTSVLVFTMPFWMILFAHVLIGERIRGPQWVAVGLALVGLTLIVAPWELTSLTGSLLAVGAGATWALSAVLSKKWPIAATDPMLFTAWQLLFGFAALTLLALVHSHEPVDWNAEYVAALVFCSIFATAAGWWLWTYVLAHTSAGIAGLNALGIPVIAVLSSAFHLGERPLPLELAGMAAIGTALALLAGLGLRGR